MALYREKSAEEVFRARKRGIVVVAIVVVVIVLALGVYAAVGKSLREQGATSVQAAILSAAEQCCAVEGSYPATLDYLENHYNLCINDTDYAITYEVFASNVPPSVVVIPR